MRLTVNGNAYEIPLAGPESLLGVLRGRLALTGTKLSCGRGECGACTVLLDGKPAYACLTLAAACEGVSVTTVEGLGQPGRLHPLQEAFIAHDALQCGYCTPGQLMAAAALLAENPRPTEDDVRRGMSGNLCRCGAYPKIVTAVLAAADRMERAGDP
jgi:aerobic-type carbon monoxide dehydrogenase small subunit (CoxS/CutS family)